MLVFLFCKLFEHYSQTNFPIIKAKSLTKITECKKVWQIFRPKWVKIKIIVIILSLSLKNESKDLANFFLGNLDLKYDMYMFYYKSSQHHISLMWNGLWNGFVPKKQQQKWLLLLFHHKLY